MEVELLTEYEFGDNAPIIAGSALKALECGCGKNCEWCKHIHDLMVAAMDSATPDRQTDKPFLMPVGCVPPTEEEP